MRTTFVGGATALSLLSMAVCSTPAEAAGHTPDINQVRAVADRLWAAKPTADDLKFLQKYPDIAAALPDGRTVEIGEAKTTQPAATAGLAASSCHSADRYMNVSSPTGSRLYSYDTVIDSWCENGTSISSSRFHDYFTNIDGGAMTDPRTGLIHELKKPAANHWVAYTGGSIKNCIFKIGCIGTKYPAQQISHYAGRGSVTYQWFNRDDSKGWQHQ
jgi:hypothetical protein